MLFIWPLLLKIWPQLSQGWPQLFSFGERDGDNFFRTRVNPVNVTKTFPYWTVVPIHWQHDFTCFCILCHYGIVNLNFHENHVQYGHSKTDDPPPVTQYTVRELSYRKHKNWKKIFENQWWDVGLGWRLSNVRETSVCLPLACWQETLLGISNATNWQ